MRPKTAQGEEPRSWFIPWRCGGGMEGRSLRSAQKVDHITLCEQATGAPHGKHSLPFTGLQRQSFGASPRSNANAYRAIRMTGPVDNPVVLATSSLGTALLYRFLNGSPGESSP